MAGANFNAIILIALVCIAKEASSEEFSGESSELPSLWATTRSDKSYHILYQLEEASLPEILTVEEWASFDKQLFRLDLISTSARTTYLTYGKTGETFRYKPFVCEQLNLDKEDFKVFSNLFLGYPLNGPSSNESKPAEPVLAYGLGPLWLRASSHSLSLKHKTGHEEDSQEFSDEFEEYEVTLRQDILKDQLPFKLRFYFPTGAYRFVDSIDWIFANKEEEEEEEEEVEARVKVLNVDWRPVDESVFKLPVGHGCKRNEQNDEKLQIDVGTVLLHDGVPSQVNFDIIISALEDEQLGKWSSRRYSMSVMRSSRIRVGQANDLESYYAIETQERSEETGKMCNWKEILWLPREQATSALVYRINLASGKCEIEHKARDHLMELKFPESLQSSEGLLQRPNLWISRQEVASLFGDNKDFHLIDEGEVLDKQRFKNRIYEKRLQAFKLASESGQYSWDGPVSIVKQISANPRYLGQFDRAKAASLGKKKQFLTLNEDYRTTTSIFFYSEQYSKLLFKVTIDLIGNHEVDYNYVHEQLDVSSCYPTNRREDITIKYPLESPELAKALQEKRQQLRVQTFVNLFEQQDSFLSPLQISNIRPSFDAFYMHLQMTILDLPLSHTFELTPDSILEVKQPNGTLQLTTSGATKCSEHCELRNCLRFSYYPFGHLCTIEVMENGARVEVGRQGGELYSYVSRNRSKTMLRNESVRPHFSPQALIEMFAELTMDRYANEADEEEKQNSTGDNFIQLGVLVKDPNKVESDNLIRVILRPNAIEHNLEAMNEYVREQEMLESSGGNGNDDWPETTGSGHFTDVIKLEGGNLKPEYRLIASNMRFNADFGKTFEPASYEECEQLCAANDCRSFSHCEGDESCRLTWLHKDGFMRKYLADSELHLQCRVYSLDYMSKFEHFGQVAMSRDYYEGMFSSPGLLPSDCASSCMDNQGISCQGFYFCKSNEQGKVVSNCYLTERHINEFASDELHQKLLEARPGSEQQQRNGGMAKEQKSCDFYSRSYLAQFDKYHGKKIRLRGDSWLNQNAVKFFTNLDSEMCAKKCIEDSCLAFHACPREGRSQSCMLVFDKIKSNQIEAEPKCSAFVLSDKSQFNAKKLKLIGGNNLRPDLEASPGGKAGGEKHAGIDSQELLSDSLKLIDEEEGSQQQTKQLKSSNLSHWFAGLLWFAFGLVLGSALIVSWNQLYANGWLDRIQQLLARR